jgi:hypothetical protein
MQTQFAAALFAAAWGFRQGQYFRLTHLPPEGMIRLWEQMCGAIADQEPNRTLIALIDRTVGSETWLGALPAVLGLGNDAFADLLNTWRDTDISEGAIATLTGLRGSLPKRLGRRLQWPEGWSETARQSGELRALEDAQRSWALCRPEAALSIRHCLQQAQQPSIATALLGILLGTHLHPTSLPYHWGLIPETNSLGSAAQRLERFWEGNLHP